MKWILGQLGLDGPKPKTPARSANVDDDDDGWVEDDKDEEREREAHLAENKAWAVARAKALLELSPIILDTETTGLDKTDQVIEIACVDIEGALLFHSFVKPTVSIQEGARAVHGITDETLDDAPSIGDIMDELLQAVGDRLVLSYNWEFDRRLIRQTVRGSGLTFSKRWQPMRGPVDEHCLMFLYGRHRAGTSRALISLARALDQCNIKLDAEHVAHRAAADAEAARQVLLHVANT